MRAVRMAGGHIIRPHMDARMGDNINGPSLLRVPDWVRNPLGRYYLYFGHHGGDYIRMAFADSLEGPFVTHEDGVLDLADSYGLHHVASPDVYVDNEKQQIRLYYHAPYGSGPQRTRVAISANGIDFVARPDVLGNAYFRVFQWDGFYYAISMPGRFSRSQDGLMPFEPGPLLFSRDMRHTAVKLDGNTLSVFYSNAYDFPERILMSTIDLSEPWTQWKSTKAITVLEPETEYEGADQPLVSSSRGAVKERVRQLRDPGIFIEDSRTYLLYSVAGEQGIAIAELLE